MNLISILMYDSTKEEKNSSTKTTTVVHFLYIRLLPTKARPDCSPLLKATTNKGQARFQKHCDNKILLDCPPQQKPPLL